VLDTAVEASLRAPCARLVRTLLLTGALLGAGMAGVGLLRTAASAPRALPADAAARVNDRIIARDLVERVTRDVASKQNVAPDDDLRRSVVAGLIDEELLVQRGVALGLPRIDRRIRSGLSRAAIERIMQERDQTVPSDEELQAFLAAHPEIFSPGAKLRVRQMVFRIAGGDSGAARQRAEQAAQRLRAGEDFAAVRAEVGDREVAPIPDALLTRTKLLDYLGPSVVQAAAALPVGETSEPVRSSNAYHLLQVLERDASALPDLARVRGQVVNEYRRQAGDQWLRSTLDRLRAEADIVIHE
jgi:parvulin-like peptidyl-prolyl isomerase